MQYETAKYHVQTIVRGVRAGVDDFVSLDVHAINELKNKGFAAIDDLSKYYFTFEMCAGQVVALRCNRELYRRLLLGRNFGCCWTILPSTLNKGGRYMTQDS